MERKTVIKVGLGVVVVASICGYIIGSIIVRERLEDAVALAQLDIAEQQTVIAGLSEVMARGGVDAVTESVIKDCSIDERNRFDNLLGRLDAGLTTGELTELSRLFDRCASYYARQKAVMAARFEREVELYKLFSERLTLLDPSADMEPLSVTAWEDLAKIEREQSEHFEALVSLQGKIIEELRKGLRTTSPELTNLLKQVGEVQDMQTYNAARMRDLRAGLPTSL